MVILHVLTTSTRLGVLGIVQRIINPELAVLVPRDHLAVVAVMIPCFLVRGVPIKQNRLATLNVQFEGVSARPGNVMNLFRPVVSVRRQGPGVNDVTEPGTGVDIAFLPADLWHHWQMILCVLQIDVNTP